MSWMALFVAGSMRSTEFACTGISGFPVGVPVALVLVSPDGVRPPLDARAMAMPTATATMASPASTMGPRAAQRVGRPSERGEEPIARRVDLTTPEARNLPANQRVVAAEEFAPPLIPHLFSDLRGGHDVGEQHRGHGRARATFGHSQQS